MTRHQLTPTLTALNREWSSICHEHKHPPVDWRLVCGRPLAGKGLDPVLCAVRADPDPTLLGLITLHHAGDMLAGRVVIQAMLGKLVLMAVRDPEASLPDYLAAMWERIAVYPLQRRRRSIAANLALDCLKLVKSNQRQQRVELPGFWADGQPQPTASDGLDDADMVLAEGVRLGAISELTRETMRCVYVDGRTGADAAAILGASPAAVRQRCSQGVRALRAVAPVLRQQLVG